MKNAPSPLAGGRRGAAGIARAVAPLLAFSVQGLAAQQVPDTTFFANTGPAAFARGSGPTVAIDEAHQNFHTLEGRYASFARVLRDDGFVLRALGQPFGDASLSGIDVLVIANALHPADTAEWSLPAHSAFTDAEIAAVRRWVEEGGALFLIADHMPFPGGAEAMAAAFDFRLMNGFAGIPGETGPLVFRTEDGSLARHDLTAGVDSVATFTGEAFQPPPGAEVLLTLPPEAVSLNPQVAWEFGPDTPTEPVGGWAQGAVARVGQGRVAVFGEAAMFSAQLAGPQRSPMGMNAPVAAENPRFLVNLVRWLAGGDE